MQNKVVFTQEDLLSILPTPVQKDLPAIGVLQKVQWFSISSKTMSYNFIHLSITRTACCLLHLKENEQVRVFQTVHGEPQFSAILQFYAGFTKLKVSKTSSLQQISLTMSLPSFFCSVVMHR